MVVLQQMAVFFILMMTGLVMRRARILEAEFLPKLSALIVNVAGPCLILSGAIRAEERMELHAAGFAFLVFGALLAALVALGWALPALLRYPARLRHVANFAFWMTNIGYLGMPFASASFGPQAMIYVTLFLIPNNLLLYTYAIWLMQRGRDDPEPMQLRKLLNPGTVATLLTVVVYFGGIGLPYVVSQPILMLGETTGPLSMILVGAQLYDANLKQLFLDVRLLLFTVLKMIVLPALLVLALKPFVADAALLQACLTIVAMPSGVLVSGYALLYDPPCAPEAVKIVTFTTFVAVATIPFVALVCGI